MSSEGSVTVWLNELKAGDDIAAQQLWNRYFARVVAFCRKTLADQPRRASDEEDVALIAFENFFRGAQEGRFPRLDDRDDLWQLLVMIASRKASSQIQYQNRKKRGAGRVTGESGFAEACNSAQPRAIDQVTGDEPTPEFAASMVEEYQRLVELLGEDELRRIAQLKLENYTHKEIAERIDRPLRAVERKVCLIRKKWSKEDDSPE